ncbi:aspartate decarboxylase [Rhizobium altiplani]|uniref:Aspartate 1-decarboxylase n=1 Tax=Rhizobium altiplani TaxID=1864509 RepID=A0A125Q537_9HYPH|nr:MULTISPECIES: aspartate 1-decarboxylase [Rhizobium]KWV43520.1 aspartate decarboxylase [Rhizobium altiplani]
MRKVVAAKLHGITVTGADLNYYGSITLDPDHCDEAGILPLEFVEIWNRDSGARISTYVIYGERGSRCCVLNGAAARTCQVGDEIIICSSTYIEEHKIAIIKPRVLTFDRDNSIRDRMFYDASTRDDGTMTFAVNKGSPGVNALKVPGRG